MYYCVRLLYDGAYKFLAGLSCGDLMWSNLRVYATRLISQEMEQLKASVRSKSEIAFLRKTLRQNYDRFISEGAGRVR